MAGYEKQGTSYDPDARGHERIGRKSMVTQPQLTERQIEIVNGVCVGYTNKLIAIKLGITENTVKVHVRTLLELLGLRNRAHLAYWASFNRVVSRDPKS